MRATQRKNPSKLMQRLLLFLPIAVCVYWLFSGLTANVIYRLEVRTLENELGISLEDYGSVTSYFSAALEPGMPIEEVYERVRGYKRVQRCSAYTEIYYFYSSDADDAERFGIWYDDNYHFESLRGEDSNSNGLANLGQLCVDRRLK